MVRNRGLGEAGSKISGKTRKISLKEICRQISGLGTVTSKLRIAVM
jgi:hypothetical protein